jgi:hypothetical protein
MGVERTDYIMWGIDVGADNVNWDRDEAEIEGQPGAKFQIVYDGMSGEYAVAGVVIAVSDDYNGFPMTDLTLAMSNMDQYMEATRLIKERFPDVDPLGFGIKVFSHFH